jgi:hypothetical protein
MSKPDSGLRALAFALVVLAVPVLVEAQAPAPQVFHCGPGSVFSGDLVAVNVGYPERNETAATVRVRLLDLDGGLLLDRTLTLTPGQSRTVRYTVAASLSRRLVLVRAEILLESGPVEPTLLGTLQLFGLGLTYGPNWQCSGDTGTRGPA